MNNLISKCKLTEMNSMLDQCFDLFICSCSFENRCLSIANNIDLSKIKHSIIVYMSEYSEYLDNNLRTLDELFVKESTNIELKHNDPIFSADTIKENLLKISKNKEIYSILLDITCFTHESLLILIRLLQIIFPVANIVCTYANAMDYDTGHEKNDKWLSKGIKDIRSVLGYSGDIIPTRKTHLIVIVGYEYERATRIINAMEPNSLALAFGTSDDATTDKNRNANEHYMQLVKQMAVCYQDIKSFTIKCDDPFETFDILLRHINEEDNKNIIMIPLNNKITTIGAAFTAMHNNNIQLCYAPALIYNFTDYSIPGDSCYIFNITKILTQEA
jgi:hypothetical protein